MTAGEGSGTTAAVLAGTPELGVAQARSQPIRPGCSGGYLPRVTSPRYSTCARRRIALTQPTGPRRSWTRAIGGLHYGTRLRNCPSAGGWPAPAGWRQQGSAMPRNASRRGLTRAGSLRSTSRPSPARIPNPGVSTLGQDGGSDLMVLVPGLASGVP